MLEDVIQFVCVNFSMLMVAVAFPVAAANTSLARSAAYGNFFEQLFRWMAFFGAGLTGIFCFFGHVFAPATVAANIDWPTSPFQYEVGMADLTVGVLGILAFRRDPSFRRAATIAAVCWYGGDAIGHIRQIIVAHNYAPGNAGPWLWSDILIPLVMAITLILAGRTQGSSHARLLAELQNSSAS